MIRRRSKTGGASGPLALAVNLALVVAIAGCSSGGGNDDGRPSQGGAGRAEPASGTAGGAAGAGIATCYEAPVDGAPGKMRFTDATADLGLEAALPAVHGHAAAVGDVDADGWPDVFVGGFADKPTPDDVELPDRLLLGGPSGFTAGPALPLEPGRTAGAAFADLDGDADLDLVVARNHRSSARGRGPSVVLRNDGGTLVTGTVLDAERGARSVGVLDYDGDGRLDLFLAEDRFTDGSSVLLRNDGSLAFSDATAAAGLPRDVHGLGVAAADLTGDGRPDLFVAGSNRLFVNEGGTFAEGDSDVFTWEPIGDEDDPAGVAAADVNHDGHVDLVVGQHYNSTIDGDARVPVRLYLNEGTASGGAPRFRDVTEEAGLVGLPTKAPHVEMVDLDADGEIDILTTASADDGTAPAVFRNLGSERGGVPRFEPPKGTGSDRYWIAGATFDADRDGRLDVLLVEWEPSRPSRLLRSTAETGHWLSVQVGPVGTEGLGAQVEAFRPGHRGDPSARLGSTTISASTGFGSGALPVATLGLGAETEAEVSLTVPGRPRPIELPSTGADRFIVVALRDETGCAG